MLIEKEVIRPGTYWYREEVSGLPRKLVVTPELTKHWHDEGNKMLSAGLTVPVPCEHDFDAHPMTPADKLKANAGWVKEYRLSDGKGGPGDRLFSILDVQDGEVAKKLPGTIRWTSPWINSFTDGAGKEWKNVISHLALTTRPRIVEQAPFPSIAAALSLATETTLDAPSALLERSGGEACTRGSSTATVRVAGEVDGICLSIAGFLTEGKKSKQLRPRYPMAFSLYGGGIKLGSEDFPSKKKDKKPAPPKSSEGGNNDGGSGSGGSSADGSKSGIPIDDDSDDDSNDDGFDGDSHGMGSSANPLADAGGDVRMEEMLCDLLQALGVPMPDDSNESEFKRHLYEATMCKIKELTNKAQNPTPPPVPNQQMKPPGGRPQPNPLIQQEQQPMYMSLEDITKIDDPVMKNIALSMYNENVKLRSELEANAKTANSLRDAKLQDETARRLQRVTMLGKLSPRVKTDLDAMLALPSMALSMGDGGTVTDPMAVTLAMLEKGLADMPRLLTTEQSALSVLAQPTDGDTLSDERQNELADNMARQMGCPPERRAG